MVLRLALICHAPTSATRTASFPADEPLDDRGRERARSRPWRGGGATTVQLTSPALAARQTAAAMAMAAHLDPDLRECDYGAWSGRSLGDVQTDDPDGLACWLADPASRPHGGEATADLLARVAAWLDGQDRAGHLVAVTHASVVRAAVVAALQAPPRAFWRIDISPLSVTRLRRSAGQWTLVSANQRMGGPHLQDDL